MEKEARSRPVYIAYGRRPLVENSEIKDLGEGNPTREVT